MSKYYYDFHIHSCLSPCGDNDMTPNNIANMAALAGLNIVALTDHNSSKNCPAFFAAARKAGIVAVAGMELTTAEEIHMICLFEHLDECMAFDKEVEQYRTMIENKTEIFGEQLILDESDNIIGYDEHLLPIATSIPLEDVPGLVSKYNGICYPAHIDRASTSIISVLGAIPDTPSFKMAEIYDIEKLDDFKMKYPLLKDMNVITCSDAHYLWDIRDKSAYFELEDEPYSSYYIRQRLFEKLRGI